MRLCLFLIIYAVILTNQPSYTTQSHAENAFKIFTALFEADDTGLPENTRVLGVHLRDGVLTLNLSKEFLLYGGNEQEQEIIRLLKETSRGVAGATHLTLYIEGQLIPLTEGRLVENEPL